MDYRLMFDRDFIGAWHLDGDKIVTITDVKKAKVKGGSDGKESSKAVLSLSEFDKPLCANITNCKTIANLYGNDTTKWRGKKVTLFPTQVQAFGAMQDCIRVRPSTPAETGSTKKRAASKALGFKAADLSGEQIFERASEWLNAFETAMNDADAETAGKLWDANQDVLYEIEASMKRAKNDSGLKRANAVGKLAHERMGPAAAE